MTSFWCSAAGGGLYSDTCSTSGVVALRRSQTISIGVAYEDVRAFMKPRLSFWGMIRLTNYPKSREWAQYGYTIKC